MGTGETARINSADAAGLKMRFNSDCNKKIAFCLWRKVKSKENTAKPAHRFLSYPITARPEIEAFVGKKQTVTFSGRTVFFLDNP